MAEIGRVTNPFAPPGCVTLARAALTEALALIEDLQEHSEIEAGNCTECWRKEWQDEPHKDDCRYIRVRDALKKALGQT